MKIRRQFSLLIICVLVMPLMCLMAIPGYLYFTSPERYLLKGYNQIRKLGDVDFSENDWNHLKNRIKSIPPNVELIVIIDGKIIISNFPEYRVGQDIPTTEVFELLRSTNSLYDYQFQMIEFKANELRKWDLLSERRKPIELQKDDKKQRNEDEKKQFSQEEKVSKSRGLVISRIRTDIPPEKRHNKLRFLGPAFVGLISFELIILTIIIFISKSISTSIVFLQKATKKIANGELDTTIEYSDKKIRANEITQLAENLEKMRQSLKDANERRVKFIMGISHDLRTPVALIKGYTEAITDGIVTDMSSVKKSLSIIHCKTDQLESMINDLINYVKLNNTDWQQRLELVKIKPVIEEFASGLNSTSEVINREIETEVNVSDNLLVKMDVNLFKRAIENLTTNALRYTKEGDKISLYAQESENELAVTIKDTGIGIKTEDMEHICELFYRGTNSRREKGMGIGLSVVKTIIDSHDWRLDVKSQEGKGSTFTIIIPLEKDFGQN